MSEQDQVATEAQTEAQPVFSIEKLYVKDLSLEVPHAPQVFLENTDPNVDMRVATESQKLEDEFYEVSVTVTVTAKLADERVIFLNEVTQSGIFRLAGIPDEDVQLLLAVACPNILFPYSREAISSAVTRAGFPPVLLAPINFEALYQQQQQQNAWLKLVWKKRPIFIGCFFGTFQTGICQSLIDSVMLGLNPSIFALQKGIDKDHTGMPARNRQLFMTKNGKAFARKWLGNDAKWQKDKSSDHKLTLFE